MTAFRTLDDVADLKGKRVLVRVDLNVPMADGKVTDDTRIRAVAPTIREISDKGGKAILLAHFGRPKDGPDPKFSLKPVVPAVAAILGRPVAFAERLHRPDGREGGRRDEGRRRPRSSRTPASTRARRRTIRLSPRRSPSSATSTSTTPSPPPTAPTPRPRASPTTCPPTPAAPCRRELEALEAALGNPKRPVVAIVGGAKVSSKIDVLEHLVAQGRRAGHRRRHGQHLPARQGRRGRQVAGRARPRRHRAAASWPPPTRPAATIVLPVDAVVATEFKAGAPADDRRRRRGARRRDDPRRRPEVGRRRSTRWIDKAATLVWNGPLGAFEVPPFDTATVAAARHAAERTQGRQASLGRRRRRDGRRAQPRRRGGRLLLRLDRRRRLPRMAGGQGAPRRRGARAARR